APDFLHLTEAPARELTASFILDFDEPVRRLLPSGDPYELIELNVAARVRGGCSLCEIRLEDGLRDGAAAIDNRVVVGQRGFRPTLDRRTIELGPGGGCDGLAGTRPFVFSLDETDGTPQGAQAIALGVVIGTTNLEGMPTRDVPSPEAWSIALAVENAVIDRAAFPPSLDLTEDSFSYLSVGNTSGQEATELISAVILGVQEPARLPAYDAEDRPASWR